MSWIDEVNNAFRGATELAKANVKIGIATGKTATNFDLLTKSIIQLNRGLSEQVGINELHIKQYQETANASLYLEKRNAELNKSFKTNSIAAAELSRSIQKIANAYGYSGKEAMQYAGNVKKLLPTLNQADKRNESQLKNLYAVQRVLTTNLGLTQEQANNYTAYASAAKGNAANQMLLTNTIAKSFDPDGTMGAFGMITEEIADSSADLQIQYGRIPGNLEIAVLKAKSLGFELADLKQTGDNLLNIESSIGQELEYQLLSGRRLVDQQGKSLTNTYREATLRGDMSKQASTLNTILEQEGETLQNNLFARKQMADLLGMDEASLSRALQKKKLLESSPNLRVLMNLDGNEFLAEAQRLAATGEITAEELKKVSETADTRTTDNILTEQLNVQIESLATMKAMLTEQQAGVVQATRDQILSSKLISEVQAGLVDFSQREMTARGAYVLGKEALADRANAVTAALNPITGNKEASVLKTPVPGNDLIAYPAGYGDRILLAGEDTFALNNEDTIVAGTNLLGQSSGTANDDKLAQTMMMVGKMIVAAINSQGSTLFAGTSLNPGLYDEA
jgi:hypothetical protein